jgi:polar amino acid transport system substrate-binding protein
MTVRTLLALAAFAVTVSSSAEPLRILTVHDPPFSYADGQEVKGTLTEAVREMIAKAGVEATFSLLPWEEADSTAQASANACIYGMARPEYRDRLFRWLGPVGANVWALYGLPDGDSKLTDLRDARDYRIGGVKGDAKLALLMNYGFTSLREADRDADNPPLLRKPKDDPQAIDLWITSQATAKEVAAAAGVRDLKEVLVVRSQFLWMGCNPRTDKETLDKLEAAAKR